MDSNIAILTTLLSSAMWGSWFLSLKYLGRYPISGFVLWLYSSSFIIVWIIVLLFTPLNQIIGEITDKNISFIFIILLSGALMAVGMHMQLIFMNKSGLILVISISSAFSAIFGLIISILVGGLPETVSINFVLLAAVILLIASFICQYSGVLRDRDRNGKGEKERVGFRSYLLLILSNFLLTGYVYGYSIGTRTEMNPDGLPPLICVAVLVTGSFIGAFLSTSLVTTRNKEWKEVLNLKKALPILMGSLSGICHYGGNILSIFTAPILSVPVTFLLGQTSHMWTYLWGIIFKEYNGTKISTKLTLGAGIFVYVIGIFLLSFGLYD
ncbi:hypothetical protein [Bacillus sp. JJ1562]|uniref:hypothetical protein n=1 Tax=Bacillus sp. JJ1562 TaxID=3122960 RepID=UPI003003533C